MVKMGWLLSEVVEGRKPGRVFAVAAVVTLCAFLAAFSQPAVAASPLPLPSAHSSVSTEATTSDAARRDAIRAIPLAKLAPEDREKVESVLSNVSVFRRMPVKSVDCDPDMFLFLVRHPDVVVNIWEVFKISRIKLHEIDQGQFEVAETVGADATVEFIYKSPELHVIYGEGTYQGPLLTRPVKGRGVLVLKTGYIREANDRYYVTSRLDSFLTIEPAGAELVTKTLSPVLGKTVDNNFVQTLAFVGSLSRTAEVNSRGVQRLGEQLTHVQPDVRAKFVELAATMPQKKAVTAGKAPAVRVASQPSRTTER
jgi:hypothetical protein